MEIYVNGPGVTIAAREIGLERYKYWFGRLEMDPHTGSGTGKDLFDYSWNIPDLREDTVFDEEHPNRNSLKVPDYADFLRDKAWSDINDPGNWVINACDYELADIWVEDGGVINRYRPHQMPHVKHAFKKFKPELQPEPQSLAKQDPDPDPSSFVNHSHYFFYTAFSSEIGNWQHKQYNSSIPIMKFRLQIMEIQKRFWIIGLETGQEHNYDMYEELRLDWHHRLHVRNRIFLEDWIKETNLRLDYDMFTGNHERDCSNFRIHDKYFWG
jgi:hypothetical protein